MRNLREYGEFKNEINEGFLDRLFGKPTVDAKDQNFVTPDDGFQKTIPENVKFFLQKRPNIRVNDLFFNVNVFNNSSLFSPIIISCSGMNNLLGISYKNSFI